MTVPVETSNINGTEALASYNSVLVNKDNFNIPLLKPVTIPKDMNAIDGERVYNSKGVLECIIKDTGDKKHIIQTVSWNQYVQMTVSYMKYLLTEIV